MRRYAAAVRTRSQVLRRDRHEAEYHLGHAREPGESLRDDRKPLLLVDTFVQPIVRVDFFDARYRARRRRGERCADRRLAEGNLRICDCISEARSRTRSCSCF